MSETVFKKEITFLQKVPKTSEDGKTMTWEELPVTKTGIFKEPSRTDREQHQLIFKLLSLVELFDDSEGSIKMNTDGLYEITVLSIQTLLKTDDKFTDQDKTEFLNDGGAILEFGIWLLKEKLVPFFAKLNLK